MHRKLMNKMMRTRYKTTGAQKTDAYEMTGAQKIDAYKMTSDAQKKKKKSHEYEMTCKENHDVRDDGCTKEEN